LRHAQAGRGLCTSRRPHRARVAARRRQHVCHAGRTRGSQEDRAHAEGADEAVPGTVGEAGRSVTSRSVAAAGNLIPAGVALVTVWKTIPLLTFSDRGELACWGYFRRCGVRACLLCGWPWPT